MLRPRQRILIGGKPYKVSYVTATGAYVIPLSRKTVTITDRNGRTRTFQTTDGEALVISTDSQNC